LIGRITGVTFYFAGTSSSSEEVETILEAAQLALSEMNVRDALSALLTAQELNIGQAEAVLTDLIADNYLECEDLLDKLPPSKLLGIHKQIIRSLLMRTASDKGDPNKTIVVRPRPVAHEFWLSYWHSQVKDRDDPNDV
jgi:hypothetical protein